MRHKHEWHQKEHVTGISFVTIYECECGASAVGTPRGETYYDKDGRKTLEVITATEWVHRQHDRRVEKY